MEKNKNLSEMSVNEILRQQLELLAERSKQCEDDYLASITNSILDVASILMTTGTGEEISITCNLSPEESSSQFEKAVIQASTHVKSKAQSRV